MPRWTAKVAFIRVRINVSLKLRPSYVTSILITKLTFAMFLLKLSTLSAAIFLFVSLVLSLLCERSTLFFFSIRYQMLISDIDKFILALFIVRYT